MVFMQIAPQCGCHRTEVELELGDLNIRPFIHLLMKCFNYELDRFMLVGQCAKI